jgi:hypothetical protein
LRLDQTTDELLPGILFTQRQAVSPEPPPLMNDFWAAVNAIADG